MLRLIGFKEHCITLRVYPSKPQLNLTLIDNERTCALNVPKDYIPKSLLLLRNQFLVKSELFAFIMLFDEDILKTRIFRSYTHPLNW